MNEATRQMLTSAARRMDAIIASCPSKDACDLSEGTCVLPGLHLMHDALREVEAIIRDVLGQPAENDAHYTSSTLTAEISDLRQEKARLMVALSTIVRWWSDRDVPDELKATMLVAKAVLAEVRT